MVDWLKLFIYFTILSLGDAIRCFECQNIPFPRDCVHVAECNSNEYCFTEQVVTTSGNVVYNVGCSSSLRCHDNSAQPFGRRLVNMSQRSTDVVACTDCCSENFCNNKGCGTTAVAPSERGPYCYNCDAVVDPRACEDVAVCLPGEVCMLYSPVEYRGLPDKIYRSKCARQSTCQSLVMKSGLNNCSGICCSDDFCNDKCSYTNYPIPTVLTPTPTTSTQFPYSPIFFSQAAITTSRPRTTQKPFQCEDNTYTELRDHSTKLCVHIMKSSVHNWHDSRKHCKGENADLVVLDTKEKANLMRHTLVERHGEAEYWIGLEDSFLNNTLYWVNGAPLDRSQSDWDHGEPDRGTDNCVYMKRKADWRQYKWHDSKCDLVRKYICERKYPN